MQSLQQEEEPPQQQHFHQPPSQLLVGVQAQQCAWGLLQAPRSRCCSAA
jgi:hypothetical protein